MKNFAIVGAVSGIELGALARALDVAIINAVTGTGAGALV